MEEVFFILHAVFFSLLIKLDRSGTALGASPAWRKTADLSTLAGFV
jgi:hypothetical protein